MKEKIKKNLITIDELSETSGVKLKQLSSYVRQGLLNYKRQAKDGTRYYDKGKALLRIREIKRLEKEGFTSKQLKDYFPRSIFEIIEELEE